MARGFAEAITLFERLPQAARARVGNLLLELAGEVSVAQKAQLAAKTSGTGFLGRGIEADVMVGELRAQAGLLAMARRKRSKRFYGRFVEFGRKAQNVWVTRGTSSSLKSATTRRRRAKGLTVREPYMMKVRGMAPRPFIVLPDIEDRVLRRAAQFWADVLPAAGG